MSPTLNYRDPGTGDFVSLGGDSTPIGSIMGWGGAAAPAGWHICDGTAHGSAELQAISGSANTPDLRDKFIIGASTTRPTKTTGGRAAVTLTHQESGSTAHTHPATTSGGASANHTHTTGSLTAPTAHTHNHGYRTDTYLRANLNEDHVDYPITSTNSSMVGQTPPAETAAGSHTHTVTLANNTATHGHGGLTSNSSTAANATESHENRPPYYAMVYIVKKA